MSSRSCVKLLPFVGVLCFIASLANCEGYPLEAQLRADVGPTPAPATTPVVLPVAFRNGLMPLGDSMVEGILDLVGPVGTRVAAGADGTGTWRAHLLEILAARGVQYPAVAFLRGQRYSTDPNLPPGNEHHQGQAGQTMAAMATSFGASWEAVAAVPTPLGAIVLLAGTNDWQVWLTSHPGDYAGAAAAGRDALATLLATIASVAGPDVVVGVVTPPTNEQHLVEADLYVPLAKTAIADARAGGQRVYLLCNATEWLRPRPVGVSGGPAAGIFVDSIHLNEMGQLMLAGCIADGIFANPF
jgi:hypothetical protein